jgi:2,4-dienoyl-CoA reductase-like NADH-dependent reductase (Old Yellow Enzyme family)
MAKDPVLEPFEIKGVRLKNRILSTAHAPSYVEDGRPGPRYRLYHEEKARGGLAMTMFGGSTTTAPDSPSAFGQINAATDAIVPHFRELAATVRRHDCRIMCQITHMGRRTCDDVADWLPTVAPSPVRERQHRSFPKAMEGHDIARVVRAYADGARRCKEGGLDGCEVIAWGHLVDQFLSPATNRRADAYGGSVENRCRFALEVFQAIRDSVGPDFVVGVRITGDENVPGGRDPDECARIAEILAGSGLLDFLNVVGGTLATDASVAHTIPSMGRRYGEFLGLAGRLRKATGLPMFQAARIPDLATARWALEQGHVDMVGMTRAHIADPHIVAKLLRGEEHRIRPCVGMGYCIDRIYQGKDALCIHNAATGREATMPHVVRPRPGPGARSWWWAAAPAGWRRPGSRRRAGTRWCCSRPPTGSAASSTSPPRRPGARRWRHRRLAPAGARRPGRGRPPQRLRRGRGGPGRAPRRRRRRHRRPAEHRSSWRRAATSSTRSGTCSAATSSRRARCCSTTTTAGTRVPRPPWPWPRPAARSRW